MYTSTLLSLLPLLAGLPGMTVALPHHSGPKLPLPALLRRQAQGQGQGALELPPSLNTPTASLSLSISDDTQPTPVPVDLPSLWQINTVPQTLLAQAQPQVESVTTSPTASVNSSGDLFVQNTGDSGVTPTSTAVNMATVEYQGDSLLQPTSISMVMAGMDMDTSTNTNTNTNMDMDITAAAAAAITSMVGILPSGFNGNSGTITSFASSTSTASSTTTSSAGTGASTTSMVSNTSSSSAIVSATATVAEAAGITSTFTSTDTSSTPSTSASDDKSKKIRYKHCSDTKGTVTEIKVNPCEGGKGTILDPCHLQAGKNYTITLTYVSPEDSTSPRANLVARDKTMSDGQQHFPYPGQSFDACQYTSCPLTNQETKSYTYEFATMNNRFDQLTFNMTNGLDGDSLMCAYFPVTFMPSLAGRSLGRNVPFGGLGARWY
ncbi:hypothetical protein L486_03020 [Kwoniella mangroviensis CBS 10435]|uniref:Phosphatidylglycerol/phosphatidylinositol transfer protein n=1 Tax=Kwoniella mangroviensis CBS 10435 TaxID=1331196 RepID=A0A1B9IXT9_9TREE|nr:hypothetical protein L486_03020 [Kwoniella mangroviensis CBS 10435]